MQKVFMLHGICDEEEFYSPHHPSPSNAQWFPWLQKELVMKGYNCQTPEVPYSYKGHWYDWFGTIDDLSIDDNTILIGHSCGCGAFLKYLSLNPDIKLAKLILVAPYLDPFRDYGDMLKCQLDENLPSRIGKMYLMKSDDEPLESVVKTTQIVQETYPDIHYTELSGYGHCCTDAMGTEEFPELLRLVIES